MYDQFYGFTGRPFQLTPDPHFYFESGTHRKAMSYLGYGLAQGEGFIVITGDIGAGKTTLVGHLMNTIDPNRLTAVKLVSTQIDGDELLRLVAEQFGLEWEGQGKAELLRAVEQFLREQARSGRRTLLIVDEGQNLPISALEELRMLSNFQLGGHSLLQIFLLGQPEFRQTLFQSPSLEQLRQRVIATHHLDPMEPEEVEPYILHRLGKVGWQGNPGFSADAFEAIYDHSEGVPRKLNVLVSRLLLYGAVEQLNRITGQHVRAVVAEVSADGGFAQPVEPQSAAAPVVESNPATFAPLAAIEPAPAFAAPFAATDPVVVETPMASPFAAPEPVPALPFAAPEPALAAPFAAAASPVPVFDPPVAVAEPAIEWPSPAPAPFAADAAAPGPFATGATPIAPFAAEPDPASPPPFARSSNVMLGRFSPNDAIDDVEPLPMPAAAGFFEARSLIADHLAASSAQQPVVAAPFGAPASPAAFSPFSAPVDVALPETDAAPAFAAPFANDLAAAPFVREAEPVDLAHSDGADAAAMVALQRQIAGLESRLVDQDAALRRVLDLLIDWVERDPAGAPEVRDWAA